MTHHDLIVIGAGSGNMLIDKSFSDLDVAIVEAGPFGGTCLNRGCIPSKMLSHPAELADAIAGAGKLGIAAVTPGLHWKALRDRVFGRTDAKSRDGKRDREGSGFVTVYAAEARFTGERRLEVDGAGEITGDRIVVAAGGRPTVPPPVADSGLPYLTSDDVMHIDTPPRRLAVLGGGYIAAELAHVFEAAGTEIVVIEHAETLLDGQDEAITTTFTDLVRERYDLRLGREAVGIDGAPRALRVRMDDDTVVEVETLLVAVGRTPNTDRIGAAAGGLALHDDGRIVVDEYQRTSVEGVFALGDVCTDTPLKHVANREAEIVAHNLHHPNDLRAKGSEPVPAAVFTNPQIAAVGLTESQCRDKGLRYRVGRAEYADIAYGWAMGDPPGFAKVLVDSDTGLLLGAHILGAQSATLIHTLTVAMTFEIPPAELVHRPYWVHPALAEIVANALLDA